MADPDERRAMAIGAVAALFAIVIGSVGSCEALGRSTRVEVGTGRGTFDLEKGADPDTESTWVALSFDLMPWLAGAHERERDERLAALIAKANLADRPLPFEQSDPPPEPATTGGEHNKTLDGPPGAEAGELPWYVTPAGMTAIGSLLTLVIGVWQRERLNRGVKSGVEHVKKRFRRVPKEKPPA